MGKLKGKVVATGDRGMLKYTNASGEKVEVNYDQPFSAEAGLAMGTRVTFEIINAGGSSVAVGVSPVNKGTVTDIDQAGGFGTITETESGIKYSFTQNYLTESNIALNSVVTYDLVCVNNAVQAVCLALAGA